jgi:hypothetical protein
MEILNQEINNIWQDKVKEFSLENPDYKIIYLTLTGSKLYGLDTSDSDTDIKGIFIPSKKDLLLQKAANVFSSNTQNQSKNTNQDVDFTLFSIHYFLNKLVKSEAHAVEMFYSMFREDTILHQTYEVSIIKDYKSSLVSINLNPFIKFGDSILKKCRLYDHKPLSHALRLSYHALDLHLNDFITFPLPDEWKNNVMQVKNGEVKIIDIIKMIKDNLDQIETDDYQNYNHIDFIDELLLNIYET